MLRKRKNRQAREEEYNIRPNDCKIGHPLSLSPCSGYGVFCRDALLLLLTLDLVRRSFEDLSNKYK